MSRPLHDLLVSLVWEALMRQRGNPRYAGFVISVSKAVFDGLVAEGMRSVPPLRFPFWSGHIESRTLRKTRVWQDDPEGFDVLIEGQGIRVTHTLTAHQRMALAATLAKQEVAP